MLRTVISDSQSFNNSAVVKKKKKRAAAEIYAMLSNSLVYKLNYQQATEKKVEHTFIFILRAVLA